MERQQATFGAGCFWGVEVTFAQIEGVVSTAVGYMGGTRDNPSYHDVCSGETGHAEVVHVEFDPARVDYQRLLDVFFANHNPTTRNRQGPDFGTQYRSVIFYHDDAQRVAAEATIASLTELGAFPRPIVTQVVPASTFWRGEEYHQQYLAKRGLKNCHLP